jgi:hypothetical protein
MSDEKQDVLCQVALSRDLESRSKRGLEGGTTAGLVDSGWRTMAAELTTETSIEERPRSSASWKATGESRKGARFKALHLASAGSAVS